MQNIIESEDINPEEVKKIPFLIEEVTRSNAYAPTLTETTVSLYLKSQNATRDYLNLLHLNTMKNCFGTIDSPDQLHECENAINSVFSKLTDKQK